MGIMKLVEPDASKFFINTKVCVSTYTVQYNQARSVTS